MALPAIALAAYFKTAAGFAKPFLARAFASATGPGVTGARGLIAPNTQISDSQEAAAENKPDSAPDYNSLNPGGP